MSGKKLSSAVNTTPISASYFGLTVESYDYNYAYLGGPVEAFPTIPVGVVRSWDVWSPNNSQIEYLDWSSLNPAAGVYNFTALNTWIASNQANNTVDAARAGRLHILEVQRLIRFMPKVVICLVNGWAAGGGHSLHVVCDLTLASREHARFKQTDADVGSFDGGYGSAYLARQVGQKFAREIFFLGRPYTAEQMHHMGAVNEVVEHAELEKVAIEWATTINAKSPQAQRMLKFAFNLLDDGLVGQQLFAGEATRLAYMTDEAVEGRDAFLEKRAPDWSPYPRYF